MITDMKNDNNVHPEDEQHFIVRPQKAETIEDTEVPLQTTVVSTPSFKLAKEVKDYSGNDIGFELADQLQINYYDAEIFDQVMKRLQADKNAVSDTGNFEGFDKYRKKKHTDLKTWFREFNRYHGLPKQDAVFFNMSDLICELAKSEDCVIMGRCADAILKNNHIPHISLFISAPFQVRVQHVMDIRNMNLKQAVRFLKQMDKQHKKYYEFYTGEKWGKPENYDLCINSANYGLKDTIELIQRMLDQKVH